MKNTFVFRIHFKTRQPEFRRHELNHRFFGASFWTLDTEIKKVSFTKDETLAS